MLVENNKEEKEIGWLFETGEMLFFSLE